MVVFGEALAAREGEYVQRDTWPWVICASCYIFVRFRPFLTGNKLTRLDLVQDAMTVSRLLDYVLNTNIAVRQVRRMRPLDDLDRSPINVFCRIRHSMATMSMSEVLNVNAEAMDAPAF